MKIIALVGPSGSGKDTAADSILCAMGHRSARRAGLADGLKYAAAELHGVRHERFFERSLKDKPVMEDGRTPRDLVLELGGLVAEKYGSRIHAERIVRQAEGRDYLLVTDLRMVDEYETLKRHDPDLTVIHIDRGLVPGPHRTEREFLEILEAAGNVIRVDNTTTIDDLDTRIVAITDGLDLKLFGPFVPRTF